MLANKIINKVRTRVVKKNIYLKKMKETYNTNNELSDIDFSQGKWLILARDKTGS